MKGEEELIAWLRTQQARERSLGLIGDDAAVLPRSETWAVTMDSQLEGVHFFADMDPADLARRLLAVNLSDLAAMGAQPAFAFLALAAPPTFDHRRFFTALTEACRHHDLHLAGGDLSRNDRCSAVLTLLGEKPVDGRWLRRSEAKVGHRLWVGGSLGEAAGGLALLQRDVRLGSQDQLQIPDTFELPIALHTAAVDALERHQRPKPQLKLGRWLGQQPEGAAMDISDGLAKDLHRMCHESRVGARVDASQLPIAPACRQVASYLGEDFRRLAIEGGEDYVLLFTLPQGLAPPVEYGCHAIGEICKGETISLLRDGQPVPMTAQGWDHFST